MQRSSIVLAVALALGACDGARDDLGDLAVVLVAPSGSGDLDQRIARAQDTVRTGRAVPESLEKLGRLYVGQARRTHDPGYYTLARLCADAIARRQPEHAGGRLLRGHVLHSLHQFAAAEQLARALVAERGSFADHGLLGDVLYDRGQPAQALEHYQRMLDLKPCLQSYARAAQVRWLRGDVDGARQLLRLAVGAGSERDPEALCWAYARLAIVELQAGERRTAADLCARALQIDPDAAGVWLAQARVLAAGDDTAGALAAAQRAVALCPLPEHRWLAADLAHQAGASALAADLEAALRRTGARDDPRHYALFLLSRGSDRARALALARQELAEREDVFTQDLHAWSLFGNDQLDEAHAAIGKALALGTGDSRIEYHAGAIAAARGDAAGARAHFAVARRSAASLWPSERADLARRMALL